MKPLPECRLYTFIDAGYLNGRDPVGIARQLCEGGSDLIQLRAKDWPDEQIKAAAQAILPVLRDHNVGLVINDHLGVAQEVSAEFCHLGQEDFFEAGFVQVSDLPALARRLESGLQPESAPRLRIGLSSHAPVQAERAVVAGADYIAIGPVFATPTKPTARAVSLDYVRWAAAHIDIPWFAIGGIHLGNLDAVIAAGATRVCVVSAILKSDDVRGACREFRRSLDA